MSVIGIIFRNQVVGIFSTDPDVIEIGAARLAMILPFYSFCSLMDLGGSQLRGMGKSLVPAIISLIGACGFRVIWIFTVFKAFHEFWIIFILYPISWFVTGSALLIGLIKTYKKLKQKQDILV